MSAPTGPEQGTSISLQELHQIRQKVENEMGILTDAITKLQAIQQHFLSSQDTSKQLEEVQEGEGILVPFCDGLLVRGTVVEPQLTLVDIGAGYFVEMTQAKCKEYCKRRLDFFNTQLVSLQRAGQEKFLQRNQIVAVLQKHMAATQQQQQ